MASPVDPEVEASWEATGIRFEKPLTYMNRRPLTQDMLGKPRGGRKRKDTKSSNKTWIRKAY